MKAAVSSAAAYRLVLTDETLATLAVGDDVQYPGDVALATGRKVRVVGVVAGHRVRVHDEHAAVASRHTLRPLVLRQVVLVRQKGQVSGGEAAKHPQTRQVYGFTSTVARSNSASSVNTTQLPERFAILENANHSGRFPIMSDTVNAGGQCLIG